MIARREDGAKIVLTETGKEMPHGATYRRLHFGPWWLRFVPWFVRKLRFFERYTPRG